MFRKWFINRIVGLACTGFATNSYQASSDAANASHDQSVKKNKYDGMALMAGSTGKQLSNDISKLLGCPTINVTTQRYCVCN